jgi:hypothetical protein
LYFTRARPKCERSAVCVTAGEKPVKARQVPTSALVAIGGDGGAARGSFPVLPEEEEEERTSRDASSGSTSKESRRRHRWRGRDANLPRRAHARLEFLVRGVSGRRDVVVTDRRLSVGSMGIDHLAFLLSFFPLFE